MSGKFVESVVEDAALQWLSELDYTPKHGPHIAPGELHQERTGFGETVLTKRLRNALAHLNQEIPVEALDDAFRKVTTTHHPALIVNNRAFHKMLVDGIPVEYRTLAALRDAPRKLSGLSGAVRVRPESTKAEG
jgi:type I restriction enzyme R subunit